MVVHARKPFELRGTLELFMAHNDLIMQLTLHSSEKYRLGGFLCRLTFEMADAIHAAARANIGQPLHRNMERDVDGNLLKGNFYGRA